MNSANADIADLVRLVLGDTFNDLLLELPNDFIFVELFDLQDLPAPGDEDDALSMLLTLLNSGLMGLARYPQTTGEFIDLISDDVSNQPVLPISQPHPFNRQPGIVSPPCSSGRVSRPGRREAQRPTR